MIKKPYSIIFICVLLIIGCTNSNSVVQKQITHIRFFDNSIHVQINEKLYHLKSKDNKILIGIKFQSSLFFEKIIGLLMLKNKN